MLTPYQWKNNKWSLVFKARDCCFKIPLKFYSWIFRSIFCLLKWICQEADYYFQYFQEENVCTLFGPPKWAKFSITCYSEFWMSSHLFPYNRCLSIIFSSVEFNRESTFMIQFTFSSFHSSIHLAFLLWLSRKRIEVIKNDDNNSELLMNIIFYIV